MTSSPSRARASARRASPYVLLLLPLSLVLACVDDESSTGPAAGEPSMPQEIQIYTGETCAPGCLRDDVPSWSIETNSTTGWTIEAVNVQSPTTRGSSVWAEWCWYYRDELTGCDVPTSWATGAAMRPTRAVRIEARDSYNTPRVTFRSTAPVPRLELLEYERPAIPSCAGNVCYGRHRIRLAVRDAGWYVNVGLTISVQSPAGGSWDFTGYATLVRTGDVFEFTWEDYMYHPAPDSRILILMQPWAGFPDNETRLYLPIAQASPSLTLDAVEAPTLGAPPGLQRVEVAAGTPVLFTPESADASLIEVLGWEWTPADTSKPVLTGACAPGENPCTADVYEDGTMKVTARVDGQLREATAPVGIAPPELVVTASPDRVEAGTLVHFQADAIDGHALNLLWRWNPDSVSGGTATCSPGQDSCDVAVQESGWMVATAEVAGVECADSAYVNVLCHFYQQTPPDDLAQDTAVQRILSDLWTQTNGGSPHTGIERGGWLIERNGSIEFHAYTGPFDLCTSQRDPTAYEALESGTDPADGSWRGPGQLVGVIHTHPLNPGTYTNTGRCSTGPHRSYDYRVLIDGPNQYDLGVHQNLWLRGKHVPAFIVDPDEVWIYEGDGSAPQPYQRDLTCVL